MRSFPAILIIAATDQDHDPMTEFIPRQRPVVLCILDGWGHRDPLFADDAVRTANTPSLNALAQRWPVSHLQASELHVGLPPGQMGNSEVGHMNLGAGRVVMQDLPRIDAAVADGSLAANAELGAFIATVKAAGGAVHLLGLLSPGGVHSHQDHMVALAGACAGAGLRVCVHAFLDGRDTPPRSAEAYLRKFIADTQQHAGVTLATVGGRYYGMDRDKRWERVALAYDALVEAKGPRAPDALAALAQSYATDKRDEFMLPAVIGDYRGMRDGDGVIMANFRADRARQILNALLEPDFKEFARLRVVTFSAALGMAEYSAALTRRMRTLFAPVALTRILPELVAEAGLTQLRLAETEKYAHVTFFFNGGEEREYPGESRELVPSPKVATYDLQPEMSARELTAKLVAAIDGGKFDLIVVNYANGDMVGHTGIYGAAVQAVQVVDSCLGLVAAKVIERDGAMIITADHGNCEMMVDPETGQPHTAHTLFPVPCMLINGGGAGRNAPMRLRDGRLADVAPTVLELLGLMQPPEMTGRSLIAPPDDAQRAA
jgi:2,3-bisphosphoglycerate-independent phosphoglycerate mutase